LRDVARRAAFFHDAAATTLRDAVARHAAALAAHAIAEKLSDAESDDLAELLASMTGDVPADSAPPERPRTLLVHVERMDGTPAAGLHLRVAPACRTLGRVATQSVETDSHGDVRVELPTATHVAIEAYEASLGAPRPIPDLADSVALVATPHDVVSVRVRFVNRGFGFPPAIIATPWARPMTRGGRVCPDASDTANVLRFVRATADDEALYAMEKPGFSARRPYLLTVSSVDDPDNKLVFDLDTTGGESAPIDLFVAPSDDADEARLARSPTLLRLRELLLVGRPK